MGRRWIIKSIFKIHPFYYFSALICFLTGYFKPFILISLIIIVHEFGHVFMALYFGWKIEKVLILPFGGNVIFNEDINRPLKEEFLILLFGPLFQILFTFFMNNNDIFNYSKALLFFNLLPVYPLDGSKIFNVILNKFLSFKYSLLLTLYVSFLSIVFLLFKMNLNLIFVLSLVFLFIRVLDEYKMLSNTFNRFLLERYTKKFKFKRYKYIASMNINKMMRDYRHIFFNGGYITEREVLKKRFDFKGKK